MVVRIAAFSDTHTKHKQLILPECDIAIFSGDLSSRGYKHELQSFLGWYSKQSQCTEKIFCAGNHDLMFDPKFENETEASKWLVEVLDYYKVNQEGSTLHYLENSDVSLFGLKIWGSPLTPWFHGDRWAFNRYRGSDIRADWENIPLDADIVVTHGPPAYLLDYVHPTNEYVGCLDLRNRLEKVNPKLHVFGHIHHNWGVEEKPYSKTLFCNAAVLDHSYYLTNQPHLIELEV